MKRGRLRTKQDIHRMPLLSVITVVYNCERSIEQTLLSVLNQSYPNIEYIVIDGNSTDKTMDILKLYNDKIDYLRSEPDNGIYDAMNKGIINATGDYVIFMNSGDLFFEENICEKIAQEILKKNPDIIYGNTIAIDVENNNEIIIKPKKIKQLYRGMIFCHQAAFIKLSLLKAYPFNTEYKIVADYDQIISLYKKNKLFYYMPLTVAKISIGGISYSNLKTTFEQIRVLKNHQSFRLNSFHMFGKLLFDLVRIAIGKNGTRFIRSLKWKLKYIINLFLR